jgi:hypothetical protein
MTNFLTSTSTVALDRLWDQLANDGASYNFPLGFDRLKLNGQTGEYLSPGRPGDDLAGLRLIFDLENVHEGWTHWDGQRPLDRWIVPWPQKPPPRAESPLRDEAEWPLGLSGKPEDPIKLAIYCPCYAENDDPGLSSSAVIGPKFRRCGNCETRGCPIAGAACRWSSFTPKA